MNEKLLLFFTLFFSSTNEQYCSFNSAQVIRVIPKNQKHIEELIKLSRLEYVWISPIINVSVINSPSLYFARVETAKYFQTLCRKLGMEAEIVVQDVQRDLIKMKSNEMNKPRQNFQHGMNPLVFNLYQYHRWREIYAFMQSLERKYPSICSVVEIGVTSEKRPMRILKISSNKNIKNKSAIWIDSTIHAREWITTNIATYIMYQLVIGYEKSNAIKKLVDDVTWYILPLINVDGYDYSWETDRMWRKNRSKMKMCERNTSDPICHCTGVDLNRNWDTEWNTTYTCPHPCCHIFAGSSPMSEPEVKNVAEFLRKNDDHIKAYVTLHNYGQLFTYPYTHTFEKYPPNYSELRELAELAAEAIQETHGKHYTVGSLSDILAGPAGSGVSIDWVVEKTKIPLSYLIEVRPTNEIGHFCLNETEIQPTSEEIFAAVKVLAQYLNGNLTLTGKYVNYIADAGHITRSIVYNLLFVAIVQFLRWNL